MPFFVVPGSGGGGGGQVNSVRAGIGISVDSSDAVNPKVSLGRLNQNTTADGGNVVDFTSFPTANCITITSGTNDIKSFANAPTVDGYRVVIRPADGVTVRVWSLNNLILSTGQAFLDLTGNLSATPKRIDYLELEYDEACDCYKQVGGEIYTAIG